MPLQLQWATQLPALSNDPRREYPLAGFFENLRNAYNSIQGN